MDALFFLSHKVPKGVVPITPVTVSSLQQWLSGQSDAVCAWLKANDFTGQAGTFVLIPSKDGQTARIVVGISEPASLWDLAALPAFLKKGAYLLEGIKDPKKEEALALGWLLGMDRFTLHKKRAPLATTLCLSKKARIGAVAQMADVLAQTRTMISTPAQEMGPQELADAVRRAGALHGAQTTIIVGDALLKRNYPAIHAVGRASARAPRLIDLTWGNPKNPRLTLIGKGVCFDSGGLDLKSSSGMFLMRKDMAGAAIALGLARLVMQRKMRVRLRLLIAAVDNAIGERAYRPSDVIVMRNGKSVEVGNTDAEGRLILADALAEAATEKPDLIIDIATLGAARGVFGSEISGFYTHDNALARLFEKAGWETEDPVWRLPLHKPYREKMCSAFADLDSSPRTPSLGLLTAGLFLDHFVDEEQRCLHVDTMAWNPSPRAGRPEGGEAMALRAVMSLLEKRYARQ